MSEAGLPAELEALFDPPSEPPSPWLIQAAVGVGSLVALVATVRELTGVVMIGGLPALIAIGWGFSAYQAADRHWQPLDDAQREALRAAAPLSSRPRGRARGCLPAVAALLVAALMLVVRGQGAGRAAGRGADVRSRLGARASPRCARA